jgi:hypothetical protein
MYKITKIRQDKHTLLDTSPILPSLSPLAAHGSSSFRNTWSKTKESERGKTNEGGRVRGVGSNWVPTAAKAAAAARQLHYI